MQSSHEDGLTPPTATTKKRADKINRPLPRMPPCVLVHSVPHIGWLFFFTFVSQYLGGAKETLGGKPGLVEMTGFEISQFWILSLTASASLGPFRSIS